MKTKHAGLIGLVALGALAFVGALQNRAEGDTAMEMRATDYADGKKGGLQERIAAIEAFLGIA